MEEGAKKEFFSYELKKEAGFGTGGEKGFEGILTGLQMKTYLCICAFKKRCGKKGNAYGWPIAVLCEPEHRFGSEKVSASYAEDPIDSAARIVSRMKSLYPSGSLRQMKKAMGAGVCGWPEEERIHSRIKDLGL